MKILVAGNYKNEIYARALEEAFMKLGYDTIKFDWFSYFSNQTIMQRFQFKYHIGPLINKINQDLVELVRKQKPDLVFIYRGILIKGDAIKRIKALGAKVIGYNNDDPFDGKYAKYVWKIFLDGVENYDFVYSFRVKNLLDYQKRGISSELLRIYYIRERNYPIEVLSDNKYKCDIMFIGHYENDGRDEMIISLFRRGYNIKLYGHAWENSKYYAELKSFMSGDIVTLSDDYNLAMNSCKIALSFLSKLNNDTYTTRCFEIPATKTFLLCERSEDMESMFLPDEEAVYFSSFEEMLKKIDYYLLHTEEREKIACAGYNRLMRDGHEVQDRCKQIIEKYYKLERM